jgi:hypothetical protein
MLFHLGNEARHFAFTNDTLTSRNAATTIAPPTYEYVNITGTNMSYVGMFNFVIKMNKFVTFCTVFVSYPFHLK